MSDKLEPLDLLVDLNAMDETGLPWAFLRRAADPARIVPGSHIIVGAGKVRAVATVVDVVDGIVHVRPLRGPVSQHRHLLVGRQAS
ncbi:MAG: hypothetical protein QOD57_4186 [Actinomycetota bacterium]|nr:hypothetical protein [Actinomycetota bacterium]